MTGKYNLIRRYAHSEIVIAADLDWREAREYSKTYTFFHGVVLVMHKVK